MPLKVYKQMFFAAPFGKNSGDAQAYPSKA
jgi:hypothetical protein